MSDFPSYLSMEASPYVDRKSRFPAPWEDEISFNIPIYLKLGLYWCEHAVLSNQTLAAALRRLVSYFVTEVEVTDVEPKEQERIKDYLYNTLNIEQILYSIGMDYLTYGNCFISLWPALNRTVTCPNCYFSCDFIPYAHRSDSGFKWINFEFHFKCIKCGYEGKFNVRPVESLNPSDLSVIRWPVHYLDIEYDHLTSKKDIILHIPPDYKQSLMLGRVRALNSVPDGLLIAAKEGQDFRFNENSIIHLAEPGLSGQRLNGWGIPPIISNFRQIWYIELLRKANQALAYDYIMPLRVLSPEPRSAPPEFGDVLFTSNMSTVAANLDAIIEDWRRNPMSWYTCPFPIRVQNLNLSGAQFPAALIDQANADLINALGLPIDFFRGSLTLQAAPFALRLLEGTWSSFTKMFNLFLRKLASTLSVQYKWDAFGLRLSRPSHFDDVNQRLAALQLAMNNIISMSTGLRTLGISYEEEVKRKMEDEKVLAEKSQELQEQLQSSALNQQLGQPMVPNMGMGMGLEGMPGPPAPIGAMGMPATSASTMGPASAQPQNPIDALLLQIPETSNISMPLDQMQNICQSVASQLFGMHPSMRKSYLYKIRLRNQIFASVISQMLEQMDRQAALQGKLQIQQQQQMM